MAKEWILNSAIESFQLNFNCSSSFNVGLLVLLRLEKMNSIHIKIKKSVFTV